MKYPICLMALLFLFQTKAQIDLSKLEGTISSDELEKSKVIASNGVNQILVDDSDTEYLRVYIQSEKLYVASLCLCSEKNKVIVMHASAALDELEYLPETSVGWKTSGEFNWEMRETEMSEAVISKRSDFLKRHGWVANTMGMGKVGHTEFIIDKSLLNGPVQLAAGLMTEANPESIVDIPKGIGTEGCAAHSLVSGAPDDTYHFKTESWIKIH